MRVAILLFDDVDLMDVAGPYEVFLTAARLEVRRGLEPTFEVVTTSTDGTQITAFGGLVLQPQVALADLGDVDILIVPGAVAIDRVGEQVDLIEGIRKSGLEARVVASVCTGAFLLERAGFLEGREVTTHWEDVKDLAGRRGVAAARDDVRWVDGGEVVTSGGLSSGIAMALHLVERFTDRELAEATARQIDYVWSETR